MNTAVFERRHVIGGAAVTEEIVPGEPKRWVRGMGVTTGHQADLQGFSHCRMWPQHSQQPIIVRNPAGFAQLL